MQPNGNGSQASGAGPQPSHSLLHRPLPTGRHALPADLVAEVQRIRLLEAMLRVVGEVGYAGTTVQLVLERAGTSRRVFYRHFGDKESCFLAAYDAGVAQVEQQVFAATATAEGWRNRLRIGLAALLAFLDEEPEIGNALLVEVHAAGTEALTRRMEAMTKCAAALDELARGPEIDTPPVPSAITAEGVIGGVEQSLRARLRDGGGGFTSLLPDLMYVAVLSYLGPAAATEELAAVPVGFEADSV